MCLKIKEMQTIERNPPLKGVLIATTLGRGNDSQINWASAPIARDCRVKTRGGLAVPRAKARGNKLAERRKLEATSRQ